MPWTRLTLMATVTLRKPSMLYDGPITVNLSAGYSELSV